MRYVLILAFIASSIFAVDVDRGELEGSITDIVEFVNYTGAQTGQIDTIAAIRAIGVELANTSETEVTFSDKYQVTRIPPESAENRGADIIEILPSARVDHIDNLRRIISAYLESRFGYTIEDADLIGQLVTVYNAVHRQDQEYFSGRFVADVINYLNADKIGISLLYSDWPGQSQLIIPISDLFGETISASDVIDESVEELLRSSPDQGFEERIAASELIDRQVEENRAALESAQNQLDADRVALESEEESLREALESGDDPALEQDLLANLEAQQELNARQDELNAQEAAIADSADRSSNIRENLATDIASLNANSAIKPILVLGSRVSGGVLRSSLVLVDENSGQKLLEGSQEIYGRSYVNYNNSILAIADNSGQPQIVLINQDSLAVSNSSDAEVSRYSPIVLAPGGNIYAVIRENNNWFAGRFDRSLNSIARSSIQLKESSNLIISGNKLFVERNDGRFVGLELNELKVSR